jgi:hypothetical protein
MEPRMACRKQVAGQLAGHLHRAGLVTVVQHVEHDVVGAGPPVLADPRGDRAGVAPDHQLVDECVAETVDVAVGESHPAEAGAVSRQAGQESQRPAPMTARMP